MADVVEHVRAGPALRVDLLGPLRVSRDGVELEVRGSRLRSLLITLALRAGRPVPQAALVDAVWAEQLPAEAANALQSLVSRLRAALGDGSLVRQVEGGYLLDAAEDCVDALRFERLGSDPRTASEALALWRGSLPSDVPGVRLEELRLTALGHRLHADLVGGTDVTAPLQDLVREHPGREDFAGLLMLSLSRQGRQAEALQEFARIRQWLADELGADPSSRLAARHLEVLRTRPAPARHNLRAALTSFVGRDVELGQIADRLRAHRLVSVVGPGGAGKTRIATEAAAVSAGSGGTWLVELAPVTDPDDVPSVVLAAIGLRETALLDRRAPAREVLERLVEALTGRGVLLVLDNAEHLLDPVAALCDALLARCPDLRVLVTSREPLGIAGESLVLLAPLEVPATGTSAAQAARHPSVVLFADRAAAVRPGFVVDDSTVDDVIELVRRLDGLPLALELAAARLRSLPLREVVRRLDDRFRLLTGGSRTALPRHRTLRAVVAWSWELLSDAERQLADRASVFPAGMTADSAAAVVQGDVGDLLAALVDKSLLQLVDGPRYRMLETLREYGAERLAGSGELARVRRAHAGWFAALVATAEPELRGPDQLRWLAVLQDERDNVLAALRCLTDLGETDAALLLGLDLGWFWLLVGRHAEAVGHLAPALALPPGQDRLARIGVEIACALHEQAMAGFVGMTERPTPVVHDLARRVRELDATGRPMLAVLGPFVLYLAHDTEAAARLLDEATGSSDAWLAAAARLFRARLAENHSDLDAVRRDVAPALEGFRAVGDRWGLASTLPLAAQLSTYDGDLDGALGLLEEAAGLAAQLGSHDLDDQVFLRLRLADLHLRQGRFAQAEQVIEAAGLLAGHDRGESSAFLDAFHGSYRRQAGDLAGADRLQAAAQARLPAGDGALRDAPHGLAIVGSTGAWLDLAHGDPAGAQARLAVAHRAAVVSRDGPIGALVAVVVAQVALELGHPADAAELLGAAARLRGAEDPTALDVRAVRDTALAALGQDGYDAAYALGWDLDARQAQARTDPALLPVAQARRL